MLSAMTIAILLTLFSFQSPNESKERKEFVLVRVYEPVGAQGEIVITYGGNKAERFAIEQLNSNHHEKNGNKIVDVCNRLAEEGYELESMASGGSGNDASLVHVSNMMFSREKP